MKKLQHLKKSNKNTGNVLNDNIMVVFSFDNQFDLRIVFKKTQVCAKFHCPTSAVTLFSKDGEGGIHSYSDIESQKIQLVEL